MRRVLQWVQRGGPRRCRRTETGLGFAVGLTVVPLFMLALARTVTVRYDGLDTTGEYGIAVVATRDIAAALDRYRAQHHRIPDAKDGLAALEPEFLGRLSSDPWGNPYVYEPTGPDWADVLSYGADGRPGGSGAGSDISARYGRLGPRPPGFLSAFVTVVLTAIPLAAFLAAPRRRWCAAVLAGIGAFWAVLLLATVGASLQASLLLLLAFAVGVAGLTGSMATLRGAPGAPVMAFLGSVAAYLVLRYLLSGGS